MNWCRRCGEAVTEDVARCPACSTRSCDTCGGELSNDPWATCAWCAVDSPEECKCLTCGVSGGFPVCRACQASAVQAPPPVRNRLVIADWVIASGMGLLFLLNAISPHGLFPKSMRPQGQLTACRSHLHEIGLALDMYATDNGGRYPVGLPDLVPRYLKVMPTCPGPGDAFAPYTSGYAAAHAPDAYTVVCHGHYHANAGQGENFPQYTSARGLLEK